MDERDARAVSHAFQLGEVLTPALYVARGAMGEIWRLDTTHGSWAVKALFEWDPPPPLPADVAVQLAARRAGLPLPRPLISAEGAAVVLVGERRFRAYEWIDLADQLVAPVSAERAAEAGEMLGTIHTLGVPSEDTVDEWYLQPPPPARWASLVAKATAAECEWTEQLRSKAPVLVELATYASTARRRPTVTCHRDFEPTNVPPTREGQLVVLDWENAGPLEPASELAYALLAWTVGSSVELAAARAFLESYADVAGPPALDRGAFNVCVATYLNFTRVMAEQAIDDANHRDFAEGQLRSLLNDCEQLQQRIEDLIEALELPDHGAS